MSSWQAHSEHPGSSPRAKPPQESDPPSPTQQTTRSSSAVPRSTTDTHVETPSSSLRKNSESASNVVTFEAALGFGNDDSEEDVLKISAYARLDFDNYTFYVQTLQVLLGRKANDDASAISHHAVDVHLSSGKAISRRHAKIFYNFGTQRFEISILGRNGAFIDDLFVEKGITVPLIDGTKIQIGDIPFTFVLPSIAPKEADEEKLALSKPINPTDALNLRTNLYLNLASPPREDRKKPESRLHSAAAESDSAAPEPPKLQRRSSKADMVRRLSNARRKSIASSTNDEITLLLKELETIGDDESTDALDAEVNELLRKGELEDHQDADDIDELVKQHSAASEPAKAPQQQSADKNGPSPVPPTDDFEISMIDQEIASLAPLINAHAHDLPADPTKLPADPTNKPAPTTEPSDPTALPRTGPLMGRPAARMGKLASVQPPAGRTYGRQPVSQLYNPQSFRGQSPLASSSGLPQGPGSIPGYPAPNSASPASSALPSAPGNPGLSSVPLASAPGIGLNPQLSMPLTASSMAAPGSFPPLYGPYGVYPNGLPANIYHPLLVPSGPPPPKILVPVDTITSVLVQKLTVPYKAITTNEDDFPKPPICVFKALDEPTNTPKVPMKKRDGASKKLAARNPGSKIAPEQYKSKPSVSILTMVSAALKDLGQGKAGLTFAEIHEKIRQLYPYYFYCPDGWQALVNHNIKFNKIFKRVFKAGLESEHLWAIDEDLIAEKERVRKKQQEVAMAKAKEAALRAVDLRNKQKVDIPQYNSPLSRSYMLPYGSPSYPQQRYPMSVSPPAGASGVSSALNGQPGQKPKSIAELASEIKREVSSPTGRMPPYFLRSGYSPPAPTGGARQSPMSAESQQTATSIKEQLAANRSRSSSQLASGGQAAPAGNSGRPSPSPPAPHGAPASATPKPSAAKPLTMNADTKKSLAYLQKELFTLYKARKLTYDTATTTDIITKALATTIAQVNIIGAKAGCGDNSLSFLVDKAPQQVSKILDIALTKSIRELEGTSRSTSKEGTPTTSSAVASPQPQRPEIKTPAASSPPKSDSAPLSKPPAHRPLPTTETAPNQAQPEAKNITPRAAPTQAASTNSDSTNEQSPKVQPAQPSTELNGSGLTRPHFSGLSKPPPIGKPGAFLKPLPFTSNKVHPPKRPSEDDSEKQSKAVKLD